MKPVLYFLRSTEHGIVKEMIRYAMRLDELGKSLGDMPELSIYERHYGQNGTDIGLYALVDNRVAGAAWVRIFATDNGAEAFVDGETPVLSIAVKPEFRRQGVGSAMLEQLLLEAGALYERMAVSAVAGSPEMAFLERFGFIALEGSQKTSPVDGKAVVTMMKSLERREVVRPTDGYDPRRWMD